MSIHATASRLHHDQNICTHGSTNRSFAIAGEYPISISTFMNWYAFVCLPAFLMQLRANQMPLLLLTGQRLNSLSSQGIDWRDWTHWECNDQVQTKCPCWM